MKIKDYKLFLESNEDIDYICQKYGIKNYSINDDGTIDVDGDVHLFNKDLKELPLKFGKVTGYFSCGHNKLNSLEGSPKFVGGYFSCYDNQLKTLEGGPKIVMCQYYCINNQLVNFKGFPEDYDDKVSIANNPVYDLIENIPEEKRNKFIYWCNEYDAIDDQGKVIHERMEEVYNKLGLEYED